MAVLAGLVVVFVATRFADSGDRTLRETLVAVDTAQIDRFVITPKATLNKEPFSVERQNGEWKVVKGAITDEAARGMVNNMVNAFAELKPIRLAGRSEENWQKYQVNDSLGTRVQVYAEDQLVADVMVGKFNYQQRTGSVANFVRLTDEQETFAVEGMLATTFGQGADAYRNKDFLKLNPEQIRTVRFDYPADSGYVLNKVGDVWQIEGNHADSATVANYFSKLRFKTMSDFIDDFKPEGEPLYKATFEGDNMTPIVVSCYEDDSNGAFYMHSSMNRNSYFTGGSIHLYDDLYVPSSKFLKKN